MSIIPAESSCSVTDLTDDTDMLQPPTSAYDAETFLLLDPNRHFQGWMVLVLETMNQKKDVSVIYSVTRTMVNRRWVLSLYFKTVPPPSVTHGQLLR